MNILQQRLSLKDTLLVLLVVTLWGISFTIIKLGLEHLPPFLFSAMRFLLAAIPAIFFIPFPSQYWREVLMIGILLGVFKFSCLFLALDGHMNAGMASVLLQAQVFMTILLSVWLFKERIKPSQLLGLILAVSGFLLLLFSTGGTFTHAGLGMILLAALFWAVSNLIMKRLSQCDLFQLMVWACAVPPVPLLAMSWLIESKEPLQLISHTQWSGWLSILFLSYFSTVLAYGLWGRLLSQYKAISITPFALLIPVVGLWTAHMILGEAMSVYDWSAAFLILLGLVFSVMGRRLRTKSIPKAPQGVHVGFGSFNLED